IDPPPEGAGLYVHIPFCHRICPYCDFAVAFDRREARRPFRDALSREIGLAAGWPLEIDTIYLGGGTPSVLHPREVAEIFSELHSAFRLTAGARVFLEANPEDADQERLCAWRELGVATVSLGVQSFSRRELRRLGRRHSPADARRAVERAREAGFDTISIDLIFALAGQSIEEWQRSLGEAVQLGVDHISCYQLTYHEGTPYWRGREKGVLTEMGEEEQATFFLRTHEFLELAGYQAYELSNFARDPRHRSRHNRKYWMHLPYLGLGPSAHSFRGRTRWWNLRGLRDYEAALSAGRSPIEASETLDDAGLALEEVMLRLRTVEGVDLEGIRLRRGLDLLERNRPRIEAWIEGGLARCEGGVLRLTPRGWAVADAIARDLDTGADRS
ncbi:MAG: radical SAM family heme chaperone HemW, partial [Planctomycetes bacterium]|nr:radical SAM family heme chaperone HemW [Planctomycetota bacterium]